MARRMGADPLPVLRKAGDDKGGALALGMKPNLKPNHGSEEDLNCPRPMLSKESAQDSGEKQGGAGRRRGQGDDHGPAMQPIPLGLVEQRTDP